MDPITLAMLVMAGGQLISGAPQIIQGISDRREAKRLEERIGDRPTYQIPDAVNQQMSILQNLASSQMPGYDSAKQDIMASTARTAGTAAQLADSPVGALTALGGAQSRELSELRDLNRRASQYQAMAQQNLAAGYGQKAQWENLAWDWNEGSRWQEGMNRIDSLRNSGAGNIMGGMDKIGAGVTQAGSAYGTYQMYNNMMPNWGGATAPAQAMNAGIGYAGNMFNNSLEQYYQQYGTPNYNYNPNAGWPY